MYNNFCKYFGINEISISSTVANDKNSINGFAELLKAFRGQSFNKGLYRIHTLDSIERWNATVNQAFPEFKGRITCFGYDWLGRQFALVCVSSYIVSWCFHCSHKPGELLTAECIQWLFLPDVHLLFYYSTDTSLTSSY